MEEWKDIPGYEGLYEASNIGRIRTAEGKTTVNAKQTRVWKQRIMKIHLTKRSTRGFNQMVSLWKDGKRKDLLVPRLVALSWCDGYSDGLTVNHIDGNPLNNKAENLEWVTLSENLKHAYRTGLKKGKPCTLINQSGDRFHFSTLSDAEKFLGRRSGYLTIARGHKTKIYSSDGEIYGLV